MAHLSSSCDSLFPGPSRFRSASSHDSLDNLGARGHLPRRGSHDTRSLGDHSFDRFGSQDSLASACTAPIYSAGSQQLSGSHHHHHHHARGQGAGNGPRRQSYFEGPGAPRHARNYHGSLENVRMYLMHCTDAAGPYGRSYMRSQSQHSTDSEGISTDDDGGPEWECLSDGSANVAAKQANWCRRRGFSTATAAPTDPALTMRATGAPPAPPATNATALSHSSARHVAAAMRTHTAPTPTGEARTALPRAVTHKKTGAAMVSARRPSNPLRADGET